MAATSGRKIRVKKNGTNIAGVKSKSLSFSGEGIDITSDDDNGFRTFLAEATVKQIDISVEGVMKTNVLSDIALQKQDLLLTDISLEFLNTDNSVDFTLTGDFYMGSLEITGETADAKNFTASLMSSGEWTYTAGP